MMPESKRKKMEEKEEEKNDGNKSQEQRSQIKGAPTVKCETA